MDIALVPPDGGPNLVVSIDNSEITRRLFAAIGCEARDTGPGAVDLWSTSACLAQHERFAVTYLAEELRSKYDDKEQSSEKTAKAVERFLESEALCAITNQKFCPDSAGMPPEYLDEHFPSELYRFEKAVLLRARKLIAKTLGPFPGWSAIIDKYCDFGPGATTRLPRRRANRANKWAGRPHVTPFPTNAVTALFSELPLLTERLVHPGFQMVAGNKLVMVPKNYKTDRCIAIEPDWNMFLQKGLGGYIRAKLKKVKQDLDCQETNQFLAAIGSIYGSLSTIDMSMASDTVAYRLVEFMISLRPDWFSELEQLRSPVGVFDKEVCDQAGLCRDEVYIFEKFSSMGNGYTFELESLIFWALARAVSELNGTSDHRTYVYGDDLICPSECTDDVLKVLRFCGFIPNVEKTHVSGPFRESCGKHYFNGSDVTPFYIREPVDKLDRLFLLHNNVCRWFEQFPGITSPDSIGEFLAWLRSHAPQEWQVPRLTSLHVGDGAFYGATQAPLLQKKRKRGKLIYKGWEGQYAITLQYVQREVRLKRRDGESYKAWIKRSRQFPAGTGPDLASLWGAMRRENRTWFETIKDLQRPLPREVPLNERHYYCGMQVLPRTPELCWFMF